MKYLQYSFCISNILYSLFINSKIIKPIIYLRDKEIR